MEKLKLFGQKIFQSPQLRRQTFFTLLIFLATRFLAHVYLPLVDIARLKQVFANDDFLSLLNVIAGGTLSTASLIAVGISPYITASIVVQLLTFVWPKLKELSKEGEVGRRKLNQYTRLLALPVAILQSISIAALLKNSNLLLQNSWGALAIVTFSSVVGSFIMLWLGELISAYGLGNGISLIMLLGIVSSLPATLAQSQTLLESGKWFLALLMAAGVIGVVALVVLINQAVRKIPIQYAKRMQGARQIGGQTTFFPIKLNTSGVMPIIFAVTIMSFPGFIGRALASSSQENWQSVGYWLQAVFSQTNPVYLCLYFLIVFSLTYFSALLFFNTRDISEELKKSGAFIAGVRPGQKTQIYLERIVKRLTFVDGLFLGSIAIMPFLLQIWTGLNSLAIGGTSLLIAVAVILEINKTVEGASVGQDYDKYL